MPKSLVIVESPAKSKTINKILGKGYEVTSSMGHIIDLPQKKLGVDIENDFKPTYVVIPARKKYLAKLKKAAKDKDSIYLAADPDREGEAISWHISQKIGAGKKVYRVRFNEITKDAVLEAFKHPEGINMDLVNSQQARRILDRIVGYKLSPLLWKKVSRGLSAGRVQSVAVRLVVEREKEIKAFKPQEYWEIDAELCKKPAPSGEIKSFLARLVKKDGKKVEIKNKKEAYDLINILKKQTYIVKDISEKKKKRRPPAPFTTSKLQQEAFNELRFHVHKTMVIAQQLYEGIELGTGNPVGLITYMRTDSMRIANVAQQAAKKYIISKFGKQYTPKTFNIYKSKKGAQEAHEAIRPTLPFHEPEKVKKFLNEDQFKIYKLIWDRFIASQMEEATLLLTTVEIKAGSFTLRATGSVVLFDGFLKVYIENEGEKETLPPLSINEVLDLLRLLPSQHFTKPPPRFSDASLVKALEEKGIGRPSTYAPIIYTIITRHYIVREKGYLKPTELGTIVTELLVKHFPDIMNVEFTARMEEELDDIEERKQDKLKVLNDFYQPFENDLGRAVELMRNVRREVIETDEVCGLCGRVMVIKWSRRGRFLSCSGYPKCKNAKSITTGVKCPRPDCDGELVERRSKRGIFYGCTNYPKCKHTANKLPEKEDV